METLLYAEINIFAILILATLLYSILIDIDKQNNKRLFLNVLISQILFFLLDLIWCFIESNYLTTTITVNFIINALYFIMSGICGYFWFIYSEAMQQSIFIKNKKYKLIIFIPTLILTLMTLLSYKTHWIFYIDDNNIYHRGNLHILQIIISYGYVAFTTIKAFIYAIKKENYAERKKYLILSSFTIIPTMSCILQLITELPLMCMGITLAVINVYINSQEQLISIDPLTQLNNRNELIKCLSNKMKNNSKSLYLLIMDLDYFKKINDKFGHVEGDKALICVADTLKMVFNKKNMFIFRYGGDEFIVICEDVNINQVEKLCIDVNRKLGLNNTNPNYTLKLSIGYAKYDNTSLTIQDFINLADEQLYIVKKSRKP